MASLPEDTDVESMNQDTDLLSEVLGTVASEIPAAIEPVHPFTAVGEPITLHEGPATLLCRVDESTPFDDPTTISVEVDGQLIFALLPHRDFVFQCTTDDERIGSNLFPPYQHKFGLFFPGQSSPIHMTPISYPLLSPYEIGAIVTEEPHPLTSKEILEVQFYLVNFPIGQGNTTVRYDNSIASKRIHLQMDDGWVIDIDCRQDFNEVWKQATTQRSYTFTHVGRIKRNDFQLFSYSEVDNRLTNLFWFLSFLRGSPVGIGPIFGISDGDSPISIFRNPTITYPAKDMISWFPKFETDHLNTLYIDFNKRMQSAHWKEVVPQLVSAYGSTSEGYVETRLTTACSALKTMTWMRLVQEQKRLTRTKYKKLQASDKLHSLLEYCSVGIEIPEELEELVGKANQEQMKCPDVIQRVRNLVVHPDKNNQLTTELKIEASRAAIWYLELTLLHLFNYRGRYVNRISNETESVPWS